MILELLRQRRRRRAQARPFSKEWLDAIKRNVAFFSRLSANDQSELLSHIKVFLAEKRFEGCGGLEITGEIPMTIVAQACLLLLHRSADYFPGLLPILACSSTYMAESTRQMA